MTSRSELLHADMTQEEALHLVERARAYRISAIERLLNIMRGPGVSRPEAIHEHGCRYWREGKSHGPCTCGARELDAQLRQALIDCGVSISESPNQVCERMGLHRG